MRWSLLWLVPACGFNAHRALTRADAPAGRDAPAVDSAPDSATQAACMARWMAHTVRFAAPTTIIELDTPDYERDPWLTDDELTIYFSAVRADSLPMYQQDIYTATRASTTDPFGPAVKFTGASTNTAAEGKMTMTGDGTQLFVASNLTGNGSKGGTDIWFSMKGGGGWGALGQGKSAAVNDAGDQFDPAVTEALYFAPSNGVPQQIFVAHRADETKNFDAGTELTELADAGGTGTADPAISADQRVILFTSGRTGTSGGNDLWYATRNAVTDAFGAPQLVPDVNSINYEGDAYLSHDGCRVYFSSTRSNPGVGDWDLFVAQQQP